MRDYSRIPATELCRDCGHRGGNHSSSQPFRCLYADCDCAEFVTDSRWSAPAAGTLMFVIDNYDLVTSCRDRCACSDGVRTAIIALVQSAASGPWSEAARIERVGALQLAIERWRHEHPIGQA